MSQLLVSSWRVQRAPRPWQLYHHQKPALLFLQHWLELGDGEMRGGREGVGGGKKRENK